MESLFSEEAYQSILKRLQNLENSSSANWGKMNVSQMLVHCQFPLQVAMQEIELDRPNIFKRLLFSAFKSSLYNDKPWKNGLPTTPSFIVSDDKEFQLEKINLEQKITQFHNQKEKTEWPAHPMFGKFTREQWGQMQFKHLDHHLKQFGV